MEKNMRERSYVCMRPSLSSILSSSSESTDGATRTAMFATRNKNPDDLSTDDEDAQGGAMEGNSVDGNQDVGNQLADQWQRLTIRVQEVVIRHETDDDTGI